MGKTYLNSMLMIAALAAVAATGCTPAHADLGDDALPALPDSGMPEMNIPATPVLTPALPTRQPYATITLRGNADGADRVLVEADGMNPYTARVGLGGSFCIDIPAATPKTYTFRLTSLSKGILSSTATVTTQYDPAAPAIPGASTCSGVDPNGCGITTEICGNGIDDNCDGYTDNDDVACNTCESDYLEPNGDVAAPALAPNTYNDLHLCAGEDDYFGIEAKANDNIYVKAYFSSTQGNLDLELFAPDGKTVVASSRGFEDDEEVAYRAPSAGKYSVRVKGFSASDAVDYRIFIRVSQ